MTSEKILAEVTRIVSEELNVAEDQVKPESRLVRDLGADSLDGVCIVMALEQEFEIGITDPDMDVLEQEERGTQPITVARISQFIESKLA